MTDATTLVALIQSHQWTLVAAVALTWLVAGWRIAQPLVWDRIPRVVQYAIPVVVLVCTGTAEALVSGATWGVALATGVLAALATIGAVHGVKLGIPPKGDNAWNKY